MQVRKIAFAALMVAASITLRFIASAQEKNGAPGRIRTSDLVLRRHTLYPSELRAHVIENAVHAAFPTSLILTPGVMTGTTTRFRTYKECPRCARIRVTQWDAIAGAQPVMQESLCPTATSWYSDLQSPASRARTSPRLGSPNVDSPGPHLQPFVKFCVIHPP